MTAVLRPTLHVKRDFFHQPDVGTKLPGSPFSPGGPGKPIPVRTAEKNITF